MKLNSSFGWIVKMKGNEHCPFTHTNVIFMIIPEWWHCSVVCARKKAEHLLGMMLDELQWPTLETQRDQPSTRFIVGLSLLIKTSTWSHLREHDPPGHHTTYSIAGLRLIVMLWSILFAQWLFPIGIVWLQLWSQLRPQRSSGNSFK